MQDPPNHTHAKRLAELHRQIEDCLYLLTRPISGAERKQFKQLFDEVSRQVGELQEHSWRQLRQHSWPARRGDAELKAHTPRAS